MSGRPGHAVQGCDGPSRQSAAEFPIRHEEQNVNDHAPSDDRLARTLADAAGALLLDIRAVGGQDDVTLRRAGDAGAHELLSRLLAENRPHDAVLSEEGRRPTRLAATACGSSTRSTARGSSPRSRARLGRARRAVGGRRARGRRRGATCAGRHLRHGRAAAAPVGRRAASGWLSAEPAHPRS